MDFSYSIRPGVASDLDDVISMMKELADYQDVLNQFKLTLEQIRVDGFGEHPSYRFLIAEAKSTSESSDMKTVGYSLFYFTYSSVEGKCLYLEDLYVKEPYRKHGIGGDMMKTVAKVAIENGCNQYHLACLGWNSPALNFYKASGANDVTETLGWHMVCFEMDEMKALADSKLDKIRLATPKDVDAIITMMKELAKHNDIPDQYKLTPEQLCKDGFGNEPAFQCVVAETKSVTDGESEVVGYALFYYIYSTFEGKNVYLQDLYVKEPYRKQGFGSELMKMVAKIGVENGCKQYRSTCLGRNTQALDFLKSSGARDLTEIEDWHLLAFDNSSMGAFAAKLGKRFSLWSRGIALKATPPYQEEKQQNLDTYEVFFVKIDSTDKSMKLSDKLFNLRLEDIKVLKR